MANASVDVLVGATFAADQLPPAVTLLFQKTLPSIAAHLKWIPYGHTATVLSSLSVAEPQPTHACTILLVRLMDIQHSHPELRHEPPDVAAIERFRRAVETHVAMNPIRHVVILPCPPPPDMLQDDMYMQQEATFLRQLPRSVHVLSNVIHGSGGIDPPMAYYDKLADVAMHSPYTPSMMAYLTLVTGRQICRVFRTLKKVLVFDCDHTLWSGVVSEDGVDGVRVTPAHQAMQRFLVQQLKRGMLLCLCSKNILEDVRTVFDTHPDMVLKWDTDVLVARVNHDPKSKNVAAIAAQLNVGLDSVVFFDDNIVECQEVSQNVPAVTVVHVPTVPDLPSNFLATCWALDRPFGADDHVTDEDTNRTAMYRQHLAAIEDSSTSAVVVTPETLQLSLAMHIDMQFVDPDTSPASHVERLVQLCQRTNQFNCNTKYARTWSTVAHVLAFPGRILYAHVTDRYGHYGLVGLIASTSREDSLDIPLFLLSCRVLNRGVEHAMLQHLATNTPKATTISIAFHSTLRNIPAATFLQQLPHVRVEATPDVNADDVLYQVSAAAARQLHQEPTLATTTTTQNTGVDVQGGECGLPTLAFSTLNEFEGFLGTLKVEAVPIDQVAKFRRQQREAVKQLQPTERIWTTNNVADRRLCPQCQTHTIASTSQCTFARCRSCCYLVQKWLQRAHHVHPKAREAALALLAAAHIDASPKSTRCQIHTNSRRAND
ncbi:Aste57867_12285 [Aphanomyces stellatus]|uniref:Aste57867_12285 protein n=1 Tax=Aphanomyces stellatus TaxID=120398 RepID=A0A485KV74_9STRA|nr:hypothetical protein As57867_012240 [Aphanomyces stellatus]VFT89138.1 Aste57867_12285 [Aphanomyces stellatus]